MSSHEELYEEGRRDAAESSIRRRARAYNARLRGMAGTLDEPPVFMCTNCGFLQDDDRCACDVGGTE